MKIKSSLQEKLTALEELISKTEIPASSRYVPAAGDLCAALITTSTADDDVPWYRVRVQEVVREKVGPSTSIYKLHLTPV